MEGDNTLLIHKILDGDKEAFATLVQKYQKKVHAIAWRKIRDFHIAEEITQDAFLQVYQKLSSLRNPKQFNGWLYVIVDRLCIDWIKKNKFNTQSLQNTPKEVLEEVYYMDYETKHRETETVEHYREIVKKLLDKLPESERTVFILHHLGEMTAKEVSETLGISINTVKSKLRRARNRLQLKEELLLSQTLKSLQLSTDLTENIMRKIDVLKPAPTVPKQIMPWAAFGTALVLLLLTIEAVNQYIPRFQQPYNFDVASEPTIEITESSIILDIVSNPTLENKVGRNIIDTKNKGVGSQVSEADADTNIRDNFAKTLTSDWTQKSGPPGPRVYNIFATSENNLYSLTSTGIYKLTEDATSWTNISSNVPAGTYGIPITEHQDTLYLVNIDSILTSTDDGNTWKIFCSRPKGDAIDFIIKDKKQEQQSQTGFVMYLVLRGKGIFQSNDAGTRWISLNNGLKNKSITAASVIGNSVFIGTTQGLYRLDSGVWKQLSVDPINAVHSLAVSDNILYVATGSNFLGEELSESKNTMQRKIYRSTNPGITWTEITPMDKSFMNNAAIVNRTKLLIKDKTLLILGDPVFRSRDGGQTWTNLGFDTNFPPLSRTLGLVVAENTYYTVDPRGIRRTSDSGGSWDPFMDGIVGAKVQELIIFDNRIYVHTGSSIYESTTNGTSWKLVDLDHSKFTPKLTGRLQPQAYLLVNSKLVVVDKSLYIITPQEEEIHIFRLRPGEDDFSMIQKINPDELFANSEAAKTAVRSDIGEKHSNSKANKQTVYVEYKNSLFKLDLNSLEFTETRLVDTAKQYNWNIDLGFEFAASAETVYVETQDGKLLQSTDGGKSWKDVTSNILPNFTRIKDMTFAGTTVYVATDKGVLSSKTGEHWQILTDDTGTHIIIDRLAINEYIIYGANNTSIYRLDPLGKWEHISHNVPDRVISLAVNRNIIYVATEKRGIFHTIIKEETLAIGTAND
ncbi:MAG: sigma-70 family RNA polymerase sigma factor [Candidatus Poribacteria bacterium]|nr:sigma-70 family RNA polymerase sigma factor [Candidatus Poribacteria bacterium]